MNDISTLPHNYVMHEYARQHAWAGTGTLSIKCFFRGSAYYHSGGGSFRVDDSRYLVLNYGQPYSITIDNTSPIESFCIFFREGFAEDVRASLTQSDETLLADPFRPTEELHFYERTYPHDDILSPALFALRDSDSPTEAALADVMARLLHVHYGVFREVERLPAVRPATREELYRRLHLAKDYMHAHYDNPLTLDDIANAAYLSTNHFLRTFKRLFHISPHQYLTRIRLNRAQELLQHTDFPVTHICMMVGFSSVGSFSTLFQRHIGVSPDAYRREKR